MSKWWQTSKRRFLSSKQGILFLMFAAVIWLMNAFSNTYTAIVPIQIELIADSDDIMMLSPQIEIPAQINATGFSILYYRLIPRSIQLSSRELSHVDLEQPVIQTQDLFDTFKMNYPNSTNIQHFVPKTVTLPIAKAIKKSFVPTLLQEPRLAEGYQLTSELKFDVDTVYAIGNSTVLKQLNTAVFTLTEETPIKKDFTLQAKLPDSIAELARWSTLSIQVSGEVDRYSELSFRLPVTIHNTTGSEKIMISPKQVDVKFAAPLGLFRSINASGLRAEISFTPTDSGKLSVQVKGLPSLAKQVVVSPTEVSYFILE